MQKKGSFSHFLQNAEKGELSLHPFAENGLIYISFFLHLFCGLGSVFSRPG